MNLIDNFVVIVDINDLLQMMPVFDTENTCTRRGYVT